MTHLEVASLLATLSRNYSSVDDKKISFFTQQVAGSSERYGRIRQITVKMMVVQSAAAEVMQLCCQL